MTQITDRKVNALIGHLMLFCPTYIKTSINHWTMGIQQEYNINGCCDMLYKWVIRCCYIYTWDIGCCEMRHWMLWNETLDVVTYETRHWMLWHMKRDLGCCDIVKETWITDFMSTSAQCDNIFYFSVHIFILYLFGIV